MLSAGFLTGEKDFIRSKIPQEKSLADTKGQVCRATFKKSTEHAQKANHHGVIVDDAHYNGVHVLVAPAPSF